MLRIHRMLCAALLAFPALAIAQERVVPSSPDQVLLSFAPVVKRTQPAVVNIYTKRHEATRAANLAPLLQDPLLRELFGNALKDLSIPKERIVSSLGSGVIVRDDGLIVTNNHVINGSDQIRVVLSDRREFDGKVILADERADLAVVKIDAKGAKLPFLEFGNSDDLQVGDVVLAIGNPFGVGQTVTHGIVSALARTTLGIGDYQFFIQTDAAINPGNSGGALVSLDGKLIGINTAIYSRTGGSNGIGFAIPSNLAKIVVASGGSNQGKFVKPWLGATMQPVTSEVANSIGLDTPGGVMVNNVYPGSPAEDGGLKPGDVIRSIDGNEVPDPQSLIYRVATSEPGKTVSMHVVRKGKPQDVTLRLSAPPEKPAREEVTITGNNPLGGARIANISPAVASELNLDFAAHGVVLVQVPDESAAAQFRFQKGDIILKVNRGDISATHELKDAMQDRLSGWRIVFKRGGEVLNLVVRR